MKEKKSSNEESRCYEKKERKKNIIYKSFCGRKNSMPLRFSCFLYQFLFSVCWLDIEKMVIETKESQSNRQSWTNSATKGVPLYFALSTLHFHSGKFTCNNACFFFSFFFFHFFLGYCWVGHQSELQRLR